MVNKPVGFLVDDSAIDALVNHSHLDPTFNHLIEDSNPVADDPTDDIVADPPIGGDLVVDHPMTHP